MRGGWFGGGQMDGSQWIGGESGKDIGMKLLDIKEGACSENWSSEVDSS